MYYVIQDGDYPYKLAQRFNVPVQDILDANPGIDPNNLAIGTRILIPVISSLSAHTLADSVHDLWNQNLNATVSLIENSVKHTSNQQETLNNLYENANGFGNLFRIFYGNEIGDQINRMFDEQILTRLQLIDATIEQNDTAIRVVESRWFNNVELFVEFLNQLNPNWQQTELGRMLVDYLNSLKELIAVEIQNNSQRIEETINALQAQANVIADYMIDGFIKDFMLQERMADMWMY
ncbi:MAG: LysM peptidoglycan-binding domain-containing protein [Coprobacillaceae bacterium]